MFPSGLVGGDVVSGLPGMKSLTGFDRFVQLGEYLGFGESGDCRLAVGNGIPFGDTRHAYSWRLWGVLERRRS